MRFLKYIVVISLLFTCIISNSAFGQVTVNVINNSSITTALSRGDNNSYAVFGFDIQVGATVPNPKIQGIRITVTSTSGGGTLSSGEPFASFTLVKSTTNSSTYTAGSVSTVTTNSNTNNGLQFQIGSGLPLSANTHNYYFLVVKASTNLNQTGFSTGTLSINGGLWSDQNFNSGTQISGATYTTSTSSFSMSRTLYWTSHNSSSTWTDANNWTTDTSNPANGAGTSPQAGDNVVIGKITYTNQPTFSGTTGVNTLTLSTSKPLSNAITLTLGGNLTISGDMTITSDLGSTCAVSLTGSSNTISIGGSLNIGDGTNPTNGNSFNGLTSSISQLNITGDINLNTLVSNGHREFDANMSISSGTVSATNINTTNTGGGTSTFSISSGVTLNLTGATPLANLSSTGTNTITLNTTGSTIGYTGTNQTVYTSTAVANLGSSGTGTGVSYSNLVLSGSGTKTIGTAAGGTLTVGGTFNSSATSADFSAFNTVANITGNWTSSGNVTFGSGNVTESGTTTLNGGTVTTGSGTYTVTGAFTNNSGATLSAAAGTVKLNGGIINKSGATITQTSGTINSTSITNAGTVTLGNAATAFTGTLTNTGNFTAGTSTVTFGGAITLNSGTITTGSNTFSMVGLDIYGGTLQAGTGNFTNTHFTRLNAGSEVVNFGSGTTSLANGLTVNGGTINFGTGTTTINPSLSMSPLTGGTVNCSTGSVSIANGFTLSAGIFNSVSSPGTLSVSGPFSITKIYSPSNPGTFNPGTGAVTFNGNYDNESTVGYNANSNITFNNASAQSLIDGSSGTKFNNVSFTGAGTKTMSGSGGFSVASTGLLTMGTNAPLATGGVLTLKSDASGSASVDVIPSGASITGNVNVERYFIGGSLSNRGWRLLTFPVNTSSSVPVSSSSTYDYSSLKQNLLVTGTGGSGNGFDQPTGYAVNGPTILLYSTATSLFSTPSSITATNSVGSGFYFYFRGDRINNVSGKLVKSGPSYATPEANVVGLETGTLNQGGFTYALSTGGHGYNLVGNPYASTITMSSAALTNTTGFIYVYSPSGNSISPQSSVNIASGQGFFVKADTTKATASIAFSESLKSTAKVTGGSLLMGVPVAEEQEGNVTLKMVQDSANYDMTQLRFLSSYDKNYINTEDADDLNANGQAVFLGAMTADKHEVAIASQPLSTDTTSVYLSINDNTSGLYTIQRSNIANIPDMYDVWLIDHFKKDSLDLRNNNSYSFNIDKGNAATFGNSRLEVVVRKKALPPYKLVSFTGQRLNTNNILHWSVVNEYSYTSFELQRSLDGKDFESIALLQSSDVGNYTYNDQTFPSEVYYRLKQTDINNKVSYSSIVIIANAAKVFSVYPNPTSNILQFSINQEVKTSLKLNIYNSSGVLVKSGTFSTATGQQNVSSLITGNYIIELIDNSSNKKIAFAKFIKL